MKKILKRAAWVILILLVFGFLGFLYFIPPFTLAPREDFIKPEQGVVPSLAGVSNPAQRMIAERGKYLVLTIGCSGCHTPGGDKGPKYDTEYLAGGTKFTDPSYGTSVSRNLTPDPTTGLARRSDAQVQRTLRSGVFAETGRVFNPLFMPWPAFSHMTAEDRYAVMAYLRHLHPVKHGIPAFDTSSIAPTFCFYGLDYGIHDAR